MFSAVKSPFEFIYYCIYRVFKLFKRSGARDEELASSYFAILLWINTLMIVMFARFFIPKGSLNPPLLRYAVVGFLILIFFAWNWFCKNFFVKSNRYITISEFYDARYGDARNPVLIGIAYALVTFLSFIGIVSWLSTI